MNVVREMLLQDHHVRHTDTGLHLDCHANSGHNAIVPGKNNAVL